MNNNFKVYFVFEFSEEPRGGVFQFTKALKEYLSNLNLVTDDPDKADIFFINAFLFLDEILRLKLKYKDKVFIHRIDGPIRLYNKKNDIRDIYVNMINKQIADATVFQSNWSKNKSYKMGIFKKKYEATITNAPNSNIFNQSGKYKDNNLEKIKLISTSWSSNWKKGFEVYQWIDENLDFDKFEMTFIGNSPIKFKNIIYKKPMNSVELASELKNNDIFITASQKDPCSNSLIEAMHCGLPAIVLNDGGHPEIIGLAGEKFIRTNEIPNLIEKISSNYENYYKKINLPSLEDIGEQYKIFFIDVLKEKSKKNNTKKFNLLIYYKMKIKIFFLKIYSKSIKFMDKKGK